MLHSITHTAPRHLRSRSHRCREQVTGFHPAENMRFVNRRRLTELQLKRGELLRANGSTEAAESRKFQRRTP
jgi:hypothetical protein